MSLGVLQRPNRALCVHHDPDAEQCQRNLTDDRKDDRLHALAAGAGEDDVEPGVGQEQRGGGGGGRVDPLGLAQHAERGRSERHRKADVEAGPRDAPVVGHVPGGECVGEVERPHHEPGHDRGEQQRDPPRNQLRPLFGLRHTTQATQHDPLACGDVSAISVRNLRKSYDGREALRGISFEIAEGEVFSLLGPNGAGKTTTIEILEGYRTRDQGAVEVLGFDPGSAGPPFRERIGIVLQQSQLWPTLTVAETHRMFAGYYERPRDVDEVIALVGLAEKRDARVKTLSGGQKRRLDLGVALVGDPDLVFLDEPTTGFDPAARRAAWEMIRSLRSLGKTILLTTHYLDEAEQLADRVAVLREGLIIREGTPSELTGGASETEVRCPRGCSPTALRTRPLPGSR